MTKQELIDEIVWLDNVGQTDNIDLNSLTKLELKKLYDEVLDYSSTRQNKWVEQYRSLIGKNTK